MTTVKEREKECTMGKNCRFLHVCGRCAVAKLPMYECKCHQLPLRHTTLAGPPAEVDGGIEEASTGTNEELELSSEASGSESFRVVCLRWEKKATAALAAICTRSSRGLVWVYLLMTSTS